MKQNRKISVGELLNSVSANLRVSGKCSRYPARQRISPMPPFPSQTADIRQISAAKKEMSQAARNCLRTLSCVRVIKADFPKSENPLLYFILRCFRTCPPRAHPQRLFPRNRSFPLHPRLQSEAAPSPLQSLRPQHGYLPFPHSDRSLFQHCF